MRGQIVVDKVTSPSGDPTSFSFSTTGTGYAGFSLTDAATPNGQTLSPGAYSVSEAIRSEERRVGKECRSRLGTSTLTTTAQPVAGPGTATASITLAAGDTVTCTFSVTTRSQRHTSNVGDRTSDASSFGLSTTGTGYAGFSLTDAATPNDQTLAPGSYSVSEAVPAGWDLTGLRSDASTSTLTSPTTPPPLARPGTATASITLAANDTVTCTFTDTKRCQFADDKEPHPFPTRRSSDLSTTGTGYAGFSLTDAATPNGQTLSPGAYSVSEAVPAGWVLTGLSCASSLGTSAVTTTAPPVAGPGTATASITLAAGHPVTCTFTHTSLSHRAEDRRGRPPRGAT